METHKKEATTLDPSVGADGGQSLKKESTTSLPEKTEDGKWPEEELREKIRKMVQIKTYLVCKCCHY